MTRLIVNADDLGYTESVNRGILEAHQRGIVTSASLLVDRAGAEDGGRIASDTSRLGVGLHAAVDGLTPDRCAEELECQLARFHELVGRDPTHVDSHHHAHRERELFPVFESFADRHALPLRDRDARHCGGFYGARAVTVERLLQLLGELGDDTVELGCHPGYADGLHSRYREERELEIATLTEARVLARIEELGIELARWDDL